MRSESSSNVAFDRAAQVLAAGTTTSAAEFDQLIGAVTLDAAKKVCFLVIFSASFDDFFV